MKPLKQGPPICTEIAAPLCSLEHRFSTVTSSGKCQIKKTTLFQFVLSKSCYFVIQDHQQQLSIFRAIEHVAQTFYLDSFCVV